MTMFRETLKNLQTSFYIETKSSSIFLQLMLGLTSL